MSTDDGDFLDLDWQFGGNNKLLLISHGLEGNSERSYVKGLARHAFSMDWDILAWNCRSCSGEINLKPRFYHHGDVKDLAEVIDHVLTHYDYGSIFLAGFSMGGSITTKYLGEDPDKVPHHVLGGAAVSTPFDLKGSATRLDGPGMGFYRKRFIRKLLKKVEIKKEIWPDLFQVEDLVSIKTFEEFDNRFTVPLHGFKSADDFYFQASAGRFLPGLKVPFLIINARNDPFLTRECFPLEIARSSPWIYLDIPEKGGHVGFLQSFQGPAWSEIRIMEFANELI